MTMEIDAAIYRSPKRKRGHDTPHPTITTSGLSQSYAASTDHLDEHLSHSPSTRVTGKFQKLDLQSPIDLGPSLVAYSPTTADIPSHQSSPTDEALTSNNSPPPALRHQQQRSAFKPPESAEFKFSSSTTQNLGTISNQLAASTPQPSPAAASSTTRNKSPPPSSVVSDQFWHASEITGWTPDDPDEDFYGLNGVGYAKPAGKAWAISQKRKQQIADYRSRETREARQRRHEMRLSGVGLGGSRAGSRRASPRGSPGVGGGVSSGVEGERANTSVEVGKGVRFVHFDDG